MRAKSNPEQRPESTGSAHRPRRARVAAKTRGLQGAASGDRPASHPADLRQALLAEGRKALEEDGPAALSLRAIARRLGVPEAAPARHFDGKDGFLAALVRSGFDELAADRVSIAADETDPHLCARRMMLGTARFAEAHRQLFHLMVGPRRVDATICAELQHPGGRSFELFAQAIEALARQAGWPEPHLPLVAHAARAMEHGLATLLLSEDAPRADKIGFAIDLLLDGIRAAHPDDREGAVERPGPATTAVTVRRLNGSFGGGANACPAEGRRSRRSRLNS